MAEKKYKSGRFVKYVTFKNTEREIKEYEITIWNGKSGKI